MGVFTSENFLDYFDISKSLGDLCRLGGTQAFKTGAVYNN